jgi:hypothetical protein
MRCAAHRNDTPTDQTSHHRRIEGTDWVIKGLQAPVIGRGGGSFANDPSVSHRSMLNARIVTCKRMSEKKVELQIKKGKVERVVRTDNAHEILPVVALQALRDIGAGEEIFVDYKAATRKRLQIQEYSHTDYLFLRPPRPKRKKSQFQMGFFVFFLLFFPFCTQRNYF